MDFEFPPINESDPTFDWDNLLDFGVGDHFNFPLPIQFNSEDVPLEPKGVEESSELVRKRDPKLTCENFLAGRVPCACPEMDALLAEEDELRGENKNKRGRVSWNNGVLVVRCQVLGCEADISELKGYHKRHRVCLKCAGAKALVIDGESKRYCQQCGKFHPLSDFDEGKHSCLEN